MCMHMRGPELGAQVWPPLGVHELGDRQQAELADQQSTIRMACGCKDGYKVAPQSHPHLSQGLGWDGSSHRCSHLLKVAPPTNRQRLGQR